MLSVMAPIAKLLTITLRSIIGWEFIITRMILTYCPVFLQLMRHYLKIECKIIVIFCECCHWASIHLQSYDNLTAIVNLGCINYIKMHKKVKFAYLIMHSQNKNDRKKYVSSFANPTTRIVVLKVAFKIFRIQGYLGAINTGHFSLSTAIIFSVLGSIL